MKSPALPLCAMIVFSSFVAIKSATALDQHLVSLEVSRVYKRLTAPRSGACGILELIFTNHSAENVLIILGGEVGQYGDQPEFRGLVAEPYYASKPSIIPAGGDFAVLDYEWKDVSGKKVLSGSYDFCGMNPVRLSRHQNVQVLVPLHFPTGPGKYQLQIRFDNRPVRKPLSLVNDQLTNCSFFDAQTNVTVNIP